MPLGAAEENTMTTDSSSLSERLVSRLTRMRRMNLRARFDERAHDLGNLHPRTGRWMTIERAERLRARGELHIARLATMSR